MKAFLLLLAMCVLVSCAQLNEGAVLSKKKDISENSCYSNMESEEELLMNLSQEMVAEGRLHAALANLEQLQLESAEIQLQKAKILRVLDPQRAKVLYRNLLNSNCFATASHHGLGQISFSERYYREAAGHLRIAAQQAPADKNVRNDLGLVYLYLRRIPEARFELMTALELDTHDEKVASNILVLLLYQDQWQQASDLISQLGLSSVHFDMAQAEARRLRQEDSAD
ncbi:MAG: hypothetical protein ACSHXZ_13500 [Gammaproteobacteria bacterium]